MQCEPGMGVFVFGFPFLGENTHQRPESAGIERVGGGRNREPAREDTSHTRQHSSHTPPMHCYTPYAAGNTRLARSKSAGEGGREGGKEKTGLGPGKGFCGAAATPQNRGKRKKKGERKRKRETTG
eukprot:8858-Rhodomonas_salina.3